MLDTSPKLTGNGSLTGWDVIWKGSGATLVEASPKLTGNDSCWEENWNCSFIGWEGTGNGSGTLLADAPPKSTGNDSGTVGSCVTGNDCEPKSTGNGSGTTGSEETGKVAPGNGSGTALFVASPKLTGNTSGTVGCWLSWKDFGTKGTIVVDIFPDFEWNGSEETPTSKLFWKVSGTTFEDISPPKLALNGSEEPGKESPTFAENSPKLAWKASPTTCWESAW